MHGVLAVRAMQFGTGPDLRKIGRLSRRHGSLAVVAMVVERPVDNSQLAQTGRLARIGRRSYQQR
jgi:hypothetical protein